MDIEKMAVAVRPREHWETVDLGIRMVRRWSRQIYLPLALVLMPFWFLIHLIFRENPAWALLIMWWLKPMWARIPLFVLSRAMFGHVPKLGETLRELPGLFKFPFFAALTYLRFTPNRGLHLPVIMLEGLDRQARNRRITILASPLFGFNLILAMLFTAIEWLVIVSGAFSVLDMLIPQELGLSFASSLSGNSYWWLISGLYALAVCLFEPLFTAAGFAMYLNRRTVLECWDVELSFRRMVKRLASATSVLLGCLLIFTLSSPARAQSESQPSEAQISISEILADAEFGSEITEEHWRLREFKTQEKKPKKQEYDLDDILALFSAVARVFIWIVIGFVLAALAWFILKSILKTRLGKRPAPRKLTPEPGPTIRDVIQAESLPADIIAGAKKAWAAGQARQALSILFRGALLRLSEHDSLTIEDCATEEECLYLVKTNLPPDFADFFSDLTRTWQEIAYAHRAPGEAYFEDLCRQWHRFLTKSSLP